MKFHPFGAAALILGAAGVPALAQDPVIYTSNPVPAVEAVQALVRDQLDVELGVITGGSGVLLRRIEAEMLSELTLLGIPQPDAMTGHSLITERA